MYSVTHSAPAVDGLLSMLGGAAAGGAAGAAVMAYFFSKDRGRVVCYTNVKLAGHGETVFKFIADEPIVNKVFLIIEEKNYFGHRKPNLTCGFLRRVDNFLEAVHRFCWGFIYFSITIIVMRMIYVFFTGEWSREGRFESLEADRKRRQKGTGAFTCGLAAHPGRARQFRVIFCTT